MSNPNLDRTDLAARMKEYEETSQTRLVRRLPAIIRIDGKAFHTLTRGMEKPFDQTFIDCMVAATKALCDKIQGVQFAYVYSDEISLVLHDYYDEKTDSWFDSRIQKMTSVSASIATTAFLLEFLKSKYAERAEKVSFDSRVFNLPYHEVVNYLIWRQNDCTRNSIQSLAQAHFGQKKLHGLKTGQLQDLLVLEKNINWNDLPATLKRGTVVVRETYEAESGAVRHHWIAQTETPIFSKERDFVNRFIYDTTLFEAP